MSFAAVGRANMRVDDQLDHKYSNSSSTDGDSLQRISQPSIKRLMRRFCSERRGERAQQRSIPEAMFATLPAALSALQLLCHLQ